MSAAPGLRELRSSLRICQRCRLSLLRGRGEISRRSFASQKTEKDNGDTLQKYPLQGYYKLILNAPLSHPIPLAANEETIKKAQIVFGSRLLSPTQRQARQDDIDARSQVINGVRIPPKPTEPDNCCMSGCVHCVWDLFRDEMESWAEKKAEAAAKGSEPVAKEDQPQQLFDDIPVGIREFMKTEKMLKQKHADGGQPQAGL